MNEFSSIIISRQTLFGFPENLLYQNEANLNQDHILVASPLSERHDAAVLHRLADDYNELEKDSGLAA